MKLVKDLQKWIDDYNEVKTLADELELSFDFYKEELVTEGDVDAAYAKASEAVEALELKNMLRDEADQMACVLKINSGAGGTESQDWASMLMRMYLRYAEMNGYKATIANLQEPPGTCFSVQCAGKTHDFVCFRVRHSAGRRQYRSEYLARLHFMGYIPKRWCRWSERQ